MTDGFDLPPVVGYKRGLRISVLRKSGISSKAEIGLSEDSTAYCAEI